MSLFLSPPLSLPLRRLITDLLPQFGNAHLVILVLQVELLMLEFEVDHQ